jgi:hypothetical protein
MILIILKTMRTLLHTHGIEILPRYIFEAILFEIVSFFLLPLILPIFFGPTSMCLVFILSFSKIFSLYFTYSLLSSFLLLVPHIFSPTDFFYVE